MAQPTREASNTSETRVAHKDTKPQRKVTALLCGRNRTLDDELEQIATDVVDVAMKLHIALGPGLLESVYTIIMQKKLVQRGYQVEREFPMPVVFEGIKYELGFRADLLINDRFIVELKSVE